MKCKRMRLGLLIALALFAFACTGKNIAIVNTESVYKKSAASERGAHYLKTLDAELTAELTALQQKLQNASGSKKAAEAAQLELQKALMEIQQRFGAEQQQVLNVLSANFKTALEKLREKYKLDVVLASEMVLSASPVVDMTDKAVEEMDALPAEFTRLAPEKEAAKEPAAQ